jgi:hypothetical protein
MTRMRATARTVFSLLPALLLALPDNGAYAMAVHNTARDCRQLRDAALVRACLESLPPAGTPRSAQQDIVIGGSEATITTQIRNALEYAPDATCELKVYPNGAVTLCQ